MIGPANSYRAMRVLSLVTFMGILPKRLASDWQGAWEIRSQRGWYISTYSLRRLDHTLSPVWSQMSSNAMTLQHSAITSRTVVYPSSSRLLTLDDHTLQAPRVKEDRIISISMSISRGGPVGKFALPPAASCPGHEFQSFCHETSFVVFIPSRFIDE
jgi:hypothetical protein